MKKWKFNSHLAVASHLNYEHLKYLPASRHSRTPTGTDNMWLFKCLMAVNLYQTLCVTMIWLKIYLWTSINRFAFVGLHTYMTCCLSKLNRSEPEVLGLNRKRRQDSFRYWRLIKRELKGSMSITEVKSCLYTEMTRYISLWVWALLTHWERSTGVGNKTNTFLI